jgi:hypothetical protein
MIQLDFFEKDENLILKDKVRQIKESQDKQRKALFAKNGELQKKYDDLLLRLEILERNICHLNMI